jgi:hypothetical protein
VVSENGMLISKYDGDTSLIFQYRSPNKMHMLQSLFYLTIALHVSGIIITDLQEHKTTLTTASDNLWVLFNSKNVTLSITV